MSNVYPNIQVNDGTFNSVGRDQYNMQYNISTGTIQALVIWRSPQGT